jgi:hypothetical protein
MAARRASGEGGAGAVEKQHLTPLDGARVISSITATLFGYDEFILREVSPESLLAATRCGAKQAGSPRSLREELLAPPSSPWAARPKSV